MKFDPVEWAEVYNTRSSDQAAFRFGAELVYQLCAQQLNKGILVDAGCGTGHLAARLGEHHAQVVALDQDPAMLESAHRSWKDRGLMFLNANVSRLPFQDQTIATITAVSLMGCLASPESFFGEAHRVLKPGGTFIFTCTNSQSLLLRVNGMLKRMSTNSHAEGRFQLYSIAGIKDSLQKCGMKVQSVRTYNFFLNAWGFLFPPEFSLKGFDRIGRFRAARFIGRNFVVTARRD